MVSYFVISSLVISLSSAFLFDDLIPRTSVSSSTTTPSMKVPPTLPPWRRGNHIVTPPLLTKTTTTAPMISPPPLYTTSTSFPSVLSSSSPSTPSWLSSSLLSSSSLSPSSSSPLSSSQPFTSSAPTTSTGLFTRSKKRLKGTESVVFAQPFPTVMLNSGLVCTDDRHTLVEYNVSCNSHIDPILGRRRRSVLSENHLKLMMQDLGGSILSPYLSVEAPKHLHELTHDDLVQLPKTPESKFNLRKRLVSNLDGHLHQQQEINQGLSHYLRSSYNDAVKNLTSLLLDMFNSSYYEQSSVCSRLFPFHVSNIQSKNGQFKMCKQLKAGIKSFLNLYSKLKTLIGLFTEGGDTGKDREEIRSDQITYFHNKLKSVRRSNIELMELHQQFYTLVNTLVDVIYSLTNHSSENMTNFSSDSKAIDQKSIEDSLKDTDESKSLSSSNRFKDSHGQTINGNTNPVAPEQNAEHSITHQLSDLLHKSKHRGNNDLLHKSSQLSKSSIAKDGVNTSSDDHLHVPVIAESLHSNLLKLQELLSEVKLPAISNDSSLGSSTSLHHIESRMKRSLAGIVLRPDTCQEQGELIPGTNFLSLCTECAHTTILDDTYFPRYLTERICHENSGTRSENKMGCLKQGTSHGGQCNEQSIHLPILRKIPGVCMKTVYQGQEFIMDQWVLKEIKVRIGCRCQVNEVSPFASLVKLD